MNEIDVARAMVRTQHFKVHHEPLDEETVEERAWEALERWSDRMERQDRRESRQEHVRETLAQRKDAARMIR